LRANIADADVVDVSKVSEAHLGWKWWEEDVVQQYGVVLDGWTAGDKITDPSNMSTSQTVIRCDKDRGVGIERYMIRIRLRSSSRGEGIVK
jgi:hypothetical protein